MYWRTYLENALQNYRIWNLLALFILIIFIYWKHNLMDRSVCVTVLLFVCVETGGGKVLKGSLDSGSD